MQAQELRTLNPKPPNPKSQLLDTPYARSRARHYQVGGKGAPMSVAGPGSAADTCSCPMKRFSWDAGLLVFVMGSWNKTGIKSLFAIYEIE